MRNLLAFFTLLIINVGIVNAQVLYWPDAIDASKEWIENNAMKDVIRSEVPTVFRMLDEREGFMQFQHDDALRTERIMVQYDDSIVSKVVYTSSFRNLDLLLNMARDEGYQQQNYLSDGQLELYQFVSNDGTILLNIQANPLFDMMQVSKERILRDNAF